MSSFEGPDVGELGEGFSPVDLDNVRSTSSHPPVELDSVLDAAVCKPFFEALRDTELDRGVTFLDFEDGGVRKMVVMGVAYDNLPMTYVSAIMIEKTRLE
jgi:hypothetical protein